MGPVGFWNFHGKYAEPVILTINSGMIITGWSVENVGTRMFAGRERTAKSYFSLKSWKSRLMSISKNHSSDHT